MARLRTLGLGLGILHGLACLPQLVPGTGSSLYYGPLQIGTSLQSGAYVLHDPVRKLEVIDQRFGNGSDPFYSFSSTWQPRVTLSRIGITSYGQAPMPPEIRVCITDQNGGVIRCTGTYPAPVPGQYQNLRDYNLVAFQGADNILVRSVTGLTEDTLAYFPLSTTDTPFSNPANGLAGTIEVVQGDAAIDLYWGLRRSYDFFSTRFGWTAGWPTQTVKAYLNVPSSEFSEGHQSDANATPLTRTLRLGVGHQGSGIGPYVPLDIVAHEYAHLVLNWGSESALVFPYNNYDKLQKRALNESFSDMMSTAVEHEARQAFPALFPPSGKWTIGERRSTPLRYMSLPPVRRYESQEWASAVQYNNSYAMAGVTNYWFYLLADGGTAQVDGTPYTVEGVGLDDAVTIAYRTFKHKLNGGILSAPSFTDFADKAVEAANELFPGGAATLQVQKALYAVNLWPTDPAPGQPCQSSATWVASTGSFGDGSGSADYQNGLDCNWRIQPIGAEQITVAFTSFNLASGDTVYLHAGTNAGAPLLGKYHGTALPAPIVHAGGAVFVRFTTNASTVAQGWDLTYTTEATTFCGTGNLLNAPSGTLTDGSGASTYAPNTQCAWLISPPGATSVTLTFNAFATEPNMDFVRVYGALDTGQPPLLSHSGLTLPPPVTSNTGTLYIVFTSSPSTQLNGWAADWTSTGAGFCSGVTTLTAGTGNFTDGSGAANYNNNTSCAWLLQPAGATAVQLAFTAFDVQPASGGAVHDRVVVHDGADASAPVLGTYTGNALPGMLVSSGPAMYVEFVTDNATTGPGWAASYTGLAGTTCSGTQLLTAAAGSFEDGSGAGEYADNSACNWLIQPENAVSITLTFDAFSTEQDADGVIVYAGATTSSPVLGIFTGNTLPPVLYSGTGAMLVRFVSDGATTGQGFSAHYSANIVPPGAVALVGYAYWFDDDVSNKLYTGIMPAHQYSLDGQFATDGLAVGLHTLHLQFKDANGQWGAVLSRPFYKDNGTVSGVPDITSVEYWFDEDAASASTIAVAGELVQLDTSLATDGLSVGLHTLHMRFLGTDGWSSVLSRPFYKDNGTPNGVPDITSMEYWFDDDAANVSSMALAGNPVQVDTALATDGLPLGLHTLHMRFLGTDGWSSVLSRPFYQGPVTSLENAALDGYEYWFDDDHAEAVSVSVAPVQQLQLDELLQSNTLPNGLHVLHIRFHGVGGWSSVLSRPFYKAGNSVELSNKVDAYRYWFDDDDGAANDVVLSVPETPLALNASIDASALPAGDHEFHIQFRDLAGQWNPVLTQVFTRTPSPLVNVLLKVFLEGPYNAASHLMDDDLRAGGFIPLQEPFTSAGIPLAGAGGEVMSASVLATTGNDAIVDWVLVEVRDENNNAVIVDSRAALVQRDGDVVDLDGESPVAFSLPEGNYYVAIRHRNHLGVMTSASVALSSGTPLVDFTSPALATYGTEARKNVSGTMVLWMGNARFDDEIRYTGSNNDRDVILIRIGGVIVTNTVQGYHPEDVTLDGLVKYSGANNDRDPILLNTGGVTPTQVREEQLP